MTRVPQEVSNGANLMPRDSKIWSYAVKRSAAVAAVSSLCWTAMSLVAPVANTLPLSNGLDIDCFLDNTNNRVKCVTMPACPRVNGDYVVDALHTMINGHQEEYPFHCINGQVVSWNLDIDPNSTFTFGVQACRKKDLEGDWCTRYADYTYTPPEPVKCPPDSPTKTVPVGQKCAPAPDVTLEVTPGEPLGGAPKPAPAPAPAPSHTVTGDVQLYDTPGGNGTVIGELKKDDAVTLNGPCPIQNPADPDDPNNGWCKVTDTARNLTGAVWGEFVSK
jgi:hypothetical protein